MTRRQFAFWFSFGLFSLAEKLRVYGLDELAAATMGAVESSTPATASALPTHWRAAENEAWQWYERETLIKGKWTLSGITTPTSRQTGDRYTDRVGYLDEVLVPQNMRRGFVESIASQDDSHDGEEVRTASPVRRARHGRPPSKWLRSLNADEIRIWLKTVEVPEADVSGMTFWEHLTRDHSFDPVRIEGLSIDEQAKLHAAAHFGY